jgi:hypothetical protein
MWQWRATNARLGQCGEFDIRFTSAASSHSERKIQNRIEFLYLQVSLWF